MQKFEKKNIFITGRPRVGKTTIIKRCAEILGKHAGGFYTEEMKGDGIRGRKGFCLTTLDGKQDILAEVDAPSDYHVGRYGVHLDVMEKIAAPSILHAIEHKDWILIDEIGKMEEGSIAFKEALVQALNSKKRVLAAIRMNDSAFTINLKKRDDVEIIRINTETRDVVLEQLLQMLKETIGG